MADPKNSQDDEATVNDIVTDVPPANPFGEPVKPLEEYPNTSEAGKQAAALGVETEETKGTDSPVGETVVEHPLSPTDTNPNPHGTREQPFTAVAVKDPDAENGYSVTSPDEGNVTITATVPEVFLGDGRVLHDGESAKVTKEVAKQLVDEKKAKRG